jgi:exodeoxyribonuclease VII large subunit
MAEKLSLTELQLIIKDSLYLALPDMYWITAEVSEIKENYAGHCYLELIEKHPDEKNVRARAKAIIWNNRYRFLKSLFVNITGEPLRAGMKVLVRIKVEYHELYGLSLVISDIDPSFTIGEMAMKRQMVIRRLEEEGVFLMNKELEFPFVPQRIAVISSKSAAGYSDFIRHLNDNSYGYVFYTALFETIMQGTETEQSVISALDRIAANSEIIDVVAILRGGGSQSDLSWFDSYNIAYHVTQFPIPVITGIGHEKDMSVTDMVAFQSLKTPTAVADHLIRCVADAENQLNEMSSGIAENTKLIIEKYRDINESFKIKLIPVVRLMISNQKEKLSNRIIEIINFGKKYIARAGLSPANQSSKLVSAAGSYIMSKKTTIDRNRDDLVSLTLNSIKNRKIRTAGFENSLNILNPENVLKRGYTITTKKGMILRSAGLVAVDDIIETRFSDGTAKSKVLNKKKG